MRESSFNPHAQAPTSSALGLFQFVERTWLTTLVRHGWRHGYRYSAKASPAARRAALALRAEPWISARMAAELARDNALALKASLGRPAAEHELYAAHFLGTADAARLIIAAEASPSLSAATLLPRAALAHKMVFFRDGRPISCAGLVEHFRHG